MRARIYGPTDSVFILISRLARAHRIKVNELMDGGQEIADGEKDRFIESLKEMFEVSRGSPPSA